MKKVLLVVSLFLFGSTCWADNYSANFKIQTGDAALDLHLSNVNAKAATPAGANEVKSELQANYSVSEKQISFLAKQGYTLAEIQHLALLAKQSGKTIDQVAALHGKGVGWGLLAKRLGIQPSALRKLIVAQKKEARKEMMHPEALPESRKMMGREEHEKMMMKESPRMERERGYGPAGMGGKGRGRGR